MNGLKISESTVIIFSEPKKYMPKHDEYIFFLYIKKKEKKNLWSKNALENPMSALAATDKVNAPKENQT